MDITVQSAVRNSMRLDRRSFLTGAGLTIGAVATKAVAWAASGAMPSAAAPSMPAGAATPGAGASSDATSVDWAADHIFGTYPPYAHPIPYGRQGVRPVSPEVGSFDPFLMI